MTRGVERPDSTSDEAGAFYAAGSRGIRGGHPFAARRHFRAAMRLDPAREEYESGFAFADKCCRMVYLPQYYLVQLYRFVPGGRRGIWILLLLGAVPFFVLDASRNVRLAYFLAVLALCLYSWLAHWFVGLWVRRFPPH